MILELHSHTSKHSKCSSVDPVTLVMQILAKGLQGVVLTEHHYLWSQDELSRLRKEAEVNDNFLILAGQEVETDIGHVLVFGPARTIEKRINIDELRRLYPDAALVLAHPFRAGADPSEKIFLNSSIDAVEIFSSNHTSKENYLGLRLWHKYKFTAVSGSDTHARNTAGIFPAIFDHSVSNTEELVKEMKNGRCRPFFKEIPKSGSNVTVTEITIGTKGDDELRDRIIIRDIQNEDKWDDARGSTQIIAKLYDSGFKDGVFRVPKIIEVNEKERLIIEEGQRGKNLYDLVTNINVKTGMDYYRLAAAWLARLHDTRIKMGTIEDTAKREKRRFESYAKTFHETHNPNSRSIEALIEFAREKEEKLFLREADLFVQCHGDYHPKNIIIGQDMTHDISTLFISVIDFGNSIYFPPSYDVGYFIAQFQSQLGRFPKIAQDYKENYFIDSYLAESKRHSEDFMGQVTLFKIRANLSIASFLVKVGKGQGKEMDSIISRSIDMKSRLENEFKDANL